MFIWEYRPLLVFCIAVAAVLGAAAGSFLNCAAWRSVHGESVVRGRSHCPACGHTLGAAELVPVISWIFLKGRCRWCGQKISVRYPLTELGFALVTVLCVLRFGLTAECLRNYLFLCCLFLAALTDLEAGVIPNGCVIAAAVIWLAALPFLPGGWNSVADSVLAATVFGGGLLVLSLGMDWLLGRDTLGGGDIKLFAAAGLYRGLIGSLVALIAVCAAALALRGVLRRKGGKEIAFGPAVALAAAAVLLYGEPVIVWYRGLL